MVLVSAAVKCSARVCIFFGLLSLHGGAGGLKTAGKAFAGQDQPCRAERTGKQRGCSQGRVCGKFHRKSSCSGACGLNQKVPRPAWRRASSFGRRKISLGSGISASSDGLLALVRRLLRGKLRRRNGAVSDFDQCYRAILGIDDRERATAVSLHQVGANSMAVSLPGVQA